MRERFIGFDPDSKAKTAYAPPAIMAAGRDFTNVPLIDVGGLVRAVSHSPGAIPQAHSATDAMHDAARAIDAACRASGFFYVENHGVDATLRARLERIARDFFGRSEAEKMAIEMAKGGSAWRGYFPVGAELTSGKPDRKEGLYFGRELDGSDARVRARLPLHGQNLFPTALPEMREVTLEYMRQVTQLGVAVMRGIALGLGLRQDYFELGPTRDPLILFRIFNYPAMPAVAEDQELPWSVGEHTDYGFLTLLAQDDAGGLQVRSKSTWVEAPPIANTFVCNIGDMLDRLTGGLYRSTPHRVRNLSGRARMSMPLFFDPGFDAAIEPIEHGLEISDDAGERWDQASVHAFQGTYGDYLLEKVSKVFPQLRRTAFT